MSETQTSETDESNANNTTDDGFRRCHKHDCDKRVLAVVVLGPGTVRASPCGHEQPLSVVSSVGEELPAGGSDR